MEISCGVIVVYKEKQNKFLLLKQHDPNGWSFPKGHVDKDEDLKTTALRELQEEAGIKEINLLDLPMIEEHYEVTRNGKKVPKVNKYFIGIVDSKDVVIQKDEISEYRWVTFEEALVLFNYESRRETLKQANIYLAGL